MHAEHTDRTERLVGPGTSALRPPTGKTGRRPSNTSVKVGLGIAVASGRLCAPELAEGSLVRVLPDHLLKPADVYAVFPAGRTPSLKTRVFADYVARVLAR